MQTTDIFLLEVEICQLGVDQRKVNMLAIEYANQVLKRRPPVVLSHHMLMGLKGRARKMSKSDPDGAVFIEDSREEIFRKISLAYCPPDPDENPLFEYIRYIILRKLPQITICGREYQTADQVKQDFQQLVADEQQFRSDVAGYVDLLVQPIRDHFQSTPELQDLLRKVESYRVTR
jgi:tyrosyl-tRNA synthetase